MDAQLTHHEAAETVITMKPFKEFIAELFNRPARWKLKVNDSDLLTYVSNNIGKEKTLSVDFVSHKNDGAWDVQFDVDGSSDVTGLGDEIVVFSTVLDIMKDFVNRVDADKIKFDGAKGKEDGDSRVKLYNRLIKKFASSHGYKLVNKKETTIGKITLVTYELDKI